MKMDSIKLFQDSNGEWCTSEELCEKLKRIGASDCDTLFIHTGLDFGTPNRELKRRELLGELANILISLGVKTLALPTFSFSFANGEDYDARSSKTDMGSLLEYMRKLPEIAYRTSDPLLSLSFIGEVPPSYRKLSTNSLGEGSAFDVLHNSSNVKFLLFGCELGESLTYIHHVEAMLDVPYRFYKSFSGSVTDWEGSTGRQTQSIHTACGGVLPRCFFEIEDELFERGALGRERFGSGKLVCVDEPVMYDTFCDKLSQNINYFLERPFTREDLTHDYKYGKDGERVTHC